MLFGKINRFLLLGGGQLLFDLSIELMQKGYAIEVVTSLRHATSKVKIGQREILLKEALEESRISYREAANINSDAFIDEFVTDGTLGISIGAEWIFKKKFIGSFAGRLVNLHGSRLPKNRGGGGFSWLILRGERHGGSSLHIVDVGIDTGEIVECREYFFPDWCRKPIDYQQIAYKENLTLLKGFIRGIEKEHEFEITAKEDHLSTYWPRLNTELQGFINWNWKLVDIECFICAFDDPYIGASTFINNQRVFVKDCRADFEDGAFHPFQAGLIYRRARNYLFVATCEGGLVIGDIRNEAGESMIDQIRLGDRLYTHSKFLEQAVEARPVYKPQAT
jgi:methionyl-tRNA formyltransferase